jgi:hypothetical protein
MDTAFTVFVYKCAYFQPEILFYGLTALLFVLMTELILRPCSTVAVATICYSPQTNRRNPPKPPQRVAIFSCNLLAEFQWLQANRSKRPTRNKPLCLLVLFTPEEVSKYQLKLSV